MEHYPKEKLCNMEYPKTTIHKGGESALQKTKIIQNSTSNKTQTTKIQTLNPYKPPTHQNHSNQQ